MTRKNKVIVFSIIILVLFAIYILLNNNINCIFKTLFNIPCPGCGMTRAFRLILQLKIIEAFSYNILAVPLFIFIIFMLYLFISDVIKKENKLTDTLSKITNKYYKLIIILLIISEAINIYRKI